MKGLSPVMYRELWGADVVSKTEGHIRGADIKGATGVGEPWHVIKTESGTRDNPIGPSIKGEGGTTPTDGRNADGPRGSRIPPYEQRRGETPPEQREVHMVAHLMATPPTRTKGPTAATGVEWIAQQARRKGRRVIRALMHHFTVNNLWANCFTALDGTKAPGVDGVTKAMYAQDVEENLQAAWIRHLHRDIAAAPPGATGRHSQRGWHHPSLWNQLHRSYGPGDDTAGSGSDLRTAFSSRPPDGYLLMVELP